MIEIVDIDGFQAKIPIAVFNGKKTRKIFVKIIFAVSRLSGVILGWEIALRGENAESFRRCIADCYLEKSERARALGIDDPRGLVHGCIDGIFVDNGAGASEIIRKVATEDMGLIRFLPPPGRGDYKGVGEGVNSIMVRLMLALRGAFTRGKSKVEQEDRLEKKTLEPITLPEFERFLWRAIQHYNLFTNKARLRSSFLRGKRIRIIAVALFEATQRQREADGMLKFMTEDEVFERFVPWQPRTVQSGIVEFMTRHYWSPQLYDYYQEYAKNPDKKRKGLVVKVKRKNGSSKRLMWIRPDGVIDDLYLCDEDERSVGDVNWVGLEFANIDDSLQGNGLVPGRRDSLVSLHKPHGNQISAAQQKLVDKAEVARTGVDFGGLVGETIPQARQNAETQRQEAESARRRRNRADEAPPPRTAETVESEAVDSEDAFMQTLIDRINSVKQTG